MGLAFIGAGLGQVSDIPTRGVDLLQKADIVYVDGYTAQLGFTPKDLQQALGIKDVVVADRKLLEDDAEAVVDNAKNSEIVLLVGGDPFAATTHMSLVILARDKKVPITVVHNASIFTAVGITGLQLYKFGKTTSLPYQFEQEMALSVYESIRLNKEMGMHTLILLDIRADEGKFMTIKEAMTTLEAMEKQQKMEVVGPGAIVVGCSRLGREDQAIAAGKWGSVKRADYGKTPHCLIIPGNLHFAEEEVLKKLYWV